MSKENEEVDDDDQVLRMSFNETTRAISEFLEVAFHQILYLRKVYPPDLFEQKKKYNLPIFTSRHPMLSNYISDVISQSIIEISKGIVNKLILVIQDGSTSPKTSLENFTFDFQYLIDPLKTFSSDADRDVRPKSIGLGTISEAEIHLRGFLLRLNSSKNQLIQLTDKNELTWTTILELNDQKKEPGQNSNLPSNEIISPQWTPAIDRREEERLKDLTLKHKDFECSKNGSERNENKGDQSSSSKDRIESKVKKRLLPLKSSTVGMIQLQMLVVEHIRSNLIEEGVHHHRIESESNSKGKQKA